VFTGFLVFCVGPVGPCCCEGAVLLWQRAGSPPARLSCNKLILCNVYSGAGVKASVWPRVVTFSKEVVALRLSTATLCFVCNVRPPPPLLRTQS
jgi:hypothetical protein